MPRIAPLRRIATLTTVYLLFTPCAHGKEPCDDIPSTTPRQADLTCVERWIDIEQSWPPGAKARATADLATLRAEASSLDDVAFYVRVAALVALAENGHTGLSRSVIREEFGLLPIRTRWFDDGLFIIRATAEHRRLLGAEVLEIAGRSPDAMAAAMQAYFGGPDEPFRAFAHTSWFFSPAVLHAVGAIESPSSIPLVVEATSGEREVVDLAAFASEAPHPGGDPWRRLHPEPLPGEGDGWLTWPGITDTTLPWSLDDPDETFRYRLLPEHGLAHIQFRANITVGPADIGDFLKRLGQRLKTDQPRAILWDQRQNGGGDLTRTADFARTLHKHLPADGHVFVATSNATFSAGIYTAFYPEWAADARTTVIGTRVGDHERFWAETGPPIVLPESGWRIYYSLQMHDLGAGCHDRSVCHLRRKRWNLAVGSLDPETRIPERSTDLIAGRDAVVDWVLDHIAGAESDARGESD